MHNAFDRSILPFFLLLVLFLAPIPLRAQEDDDKRDPLNVPLSPAVKALLDDKDTPDVEKRRIAVYHGQWERVKEPTLEERAAIALAKYELNDPALSDNKTPPLLRARAALYRGEPERTVTLLEKENTAAAALLRAAALEQMGKEKEAIETLTPWRTKLQVEGFSDAGELTAAAQALVMLADLEGRPSRDFTQAMKLFGRARNELDKLHWPAALAEAELLMEKDNPEEAMGALLDVLRLNPRCPEAAGMLGQFAAQRFNFDDAGKIAARLRDVNPDHPLAALIDGHSFLTQKDAPGARAAIEPMLAKYPNHRELLELLAAAEAMSYDEKKMNAVLAHYDKLTGNNPGALITAGSYLSLARQYELAEKLLREAVKRRDNWAMPRIELGLMLMQAGKEPDALSLSTELRRRESKFTTGAAAQCCPARGKMDGHAGTPPEDLRGAQRGAELVCVRKIWQQQAGNSNLAVAMCIRAGCSWQARIECRQRCQRVHAARNAARIKSFHRIHVRQNLCKVCSAPAGAAFVIERM